MKLSETDSEQRSVHLEYVETRWRQLYELSKDRAEAVWRYLMVTNAGGALAVLSFMGAYKTTTPIHGAPVMLIAFLIGLFFVGIGHAVNYYRITWLFKGWRHDVKRYFTDQLIWADLIERDQQRSSYFVLADLIAWASFVSFLVGLFIGIVNVFSSTELNVMTPTPTSTQQPTPVVPPGRSNYPIAPPPPPPPPQKK